MGKHYSIEYLRENVEQTRYWSRTPGKFVDAKTGKEAIPPDSCPKFSGADYEWYSLLYEHIVDIKSSLKEGKCTDNLLGLVPRKCTDGNVYASADIMAIIEMSVFYKATVNDDNDSYKMGVIGYSNLGLIDVYKSTKVNSGELFIVNDKGHVGKIEILDLHMI